MAREADGKALVCGALQVGLSSIIGLTSIPGQLPYTVLRYLSGGTLEIVGIGGTQVGTGFTGLIPPATVGSGFQLRAGDPPLYLDMSGTIYFLSSGATSIVSVIRHLSADYS